MTTTSADAQKNLDKFQALLRELFQFDCADLDFGIYRIMNHKRDAVERFISEQLPASVAAALDGGPLAQQAQADDVLARARQAVVNALGDAAIDEYGALAETYRGSPVGRAYLDAQAAAADGNHSRDAVEADIYNHLLTFFSRYYEEGDFISKRRYSRSQRYAIPYNGEEVYLHWANSDQYYVKTDEHFRNYDWKAPNGVTVRFRLKSADIEQNNVKGDRRFFIPHVSGTEWDADGTAITIPFEYRPLSVVETTKYGKTGQQDRIIKETLSAIPAQLREDTRAVAALTGERRRNENGPVSHLEHHLRQYVGRNNSDFFIHKELSGFLNRELDFYLKNEVLNLDNLATAGQDLAEGWFQQLRLTKEVGSKIIDFLAQIEDFQKLLWEKRKFITDTQYCITLGNISPEFYPEIVTNDAQWDEWRELLAVDGNDRSEAFLTIHPTLPLDSRHFESEFVDRLLDSFDDLDGMTDGLLVHSENWQAIRTIGERYRGAIQSVYIDPPYNTLATKILYKNGYEHSTWMSLLENRLSESTTLLEKCGVVCATIDDYELSHLKLLMERTFGAENHLATVAIRNNPSGRSTVKGFAINHEYGLFFERSPNGGTIGRMQHTTAQMERYKEIDPEGRKFEWENFRKSSSGSFRPDRPKQYFPVFLDSDTLILRVPSLEWDDTRRAWHVLEDATENEVTIYPTDDQGRERVWRYGVERARKALGEGKATHSNSGGYQIYTRKYLQSKGSLPRTWWDKTEYSARDNGSRALAELFGSSAVFDFPKATAAVKDSIRVCLPDNEGVVLDYFAGSGTTGHAVIDLNREDDGERKFILVEMGEYFDSVTLPRIKKVTFAPNWKGGKPEGTANDEEAERSPRIVKYIRLESYEDALDSIRFDQDGGQLSLPDAGDEYLLKYMLRWETRDSETLLNPSRLTSPFTYRLRAHVNGEKRERMVDLPETFNYLLGLNVRQRQVYEDGGRRYLVYRGEMREAPGRRVAVIWRATEGWTDDDFARDRDFVARHNLPGDADTVYVNGDSAIPNAKPIEPMFKARMFASVNA